MIESSFRAFLKMGSEEWVSSWVGVEGKGIGGGGRGKVEHRVLWG